MNCVGLEKFTKAGMRYILESATLFPCK